MMPKVSSTSTGAMSANSTATAPRSAAVRAEAGAQPVRDRAAGFRWDRRAGARRSSWISVVFMVRGLSTDATSAALPHDW